MAYCEWQILPAKERRLSPHSVKQAQRRTENVKKTKSGVPFPCKKGKGIQDQNEEHKGNE